MLQRYFDDPTVEKIWINEPGPVQISLLGGLGRSLATLTSDDQHARFYEARQAQIVQQVRAESPTNCARSSRGTKTPSATKPVRSAILNVVSTRRSPPPHDGARRRNWGHDEWRDHELEREQRNRGATAEVERRRREGVEGVTGNRIAPASSATG